MNRKPIDWEHLTRVVRLHDKRLRDGMKPSQAFPQLEWEFYRAEYEKRLRKQRGAGKVAA